VTSPHPTLTAARSLAEDSLATLIRWEKLPEPAREFRFDSKRRWRFDFAWRWPTFGGWKSEAAGLAIEVEGGAFTGGHRRGKAYELDCEKANEAALRGWTVLRVTPAMIEDGRAIELIKRALG
jgi:hypothetical protein